MSTLTLTSTVLTITPSTTITSTGTNIVTSTPPLVSTVTSSTSTILFSTTIVVRQTITITSTSTIISTRTSRLPMCVKDASETEHYYAEDVEYTCTRTHNNDESTFAYESTSLPLRHTRRDLQTPNQ
uniref:Uncharacterized protein n=1 Tax=Anopheles coluzzii TaxID=1518534 RepID=A0A8W7PY39_ANOCL